jgi:cell division protein FtsB
MLDPAIGINAYVEEVRRQRAALGNDAAQYAADLAVTRAERDELKARVAELEKSNEAK